MSDKIEPVFLRRNYEDSEFVELKKRENEQFKHIDFEADNEYIPKDEGNKEYLQLLMEKNLDIQPFCEIQ